MQLSVAYRSLLGVSAADRVRPMLHTARRNGRVLRIGHRGASAHAPENTLAAIVKAAELGADMVELDVQASADGVPMIMHDSDLALTTNGRGSIYDQPLHALKRLDAGGGETIPTLEEAVECCRAHGLGMYLELKIGFVVDAVVDAVRRHRLHEHVVVASFRPDWLAEVRAREPITTSVLFNSTSLDPVALAGAVGARVVHPCWEWQALEPHRLLTATWLASVRAAGLAIVSWHEERPTEIAALQRLGVDAICSNAPELLR
jgi:glycerophosphoryl diester phosphodiesterase